MTPLERLDMPLSWGWFCSIAMFNTTLKFIAHLFDYKKLYQYFYIAI